MRKICIDVNIAWRRGGAAARIIFHPYVVSLHVTIRQLMQRGRLSVRAVLLDDGDDVRWHARNCHG